MIAYLLIIFGFVLRLVPHMPNMVPIAAIALFSGAYLNKKIVPWVPLAIMMVSDLIIGFHSVIPFTWGAFILIGFMGMKLRDNKSVSNIFTTSVFAALAFFVISNLGVALFWYPHTVQGFTTCFIKAIPFLRNTLIGNIAFTFVLFGVYETAKRLAEKTKFKEVLLVTE